MTGRLENRILEQCARCNGDKSFWWRGAWWSRRVLSDLAGKCEEVFREAGFQEGSRLAVLLPNSPVFLALMIAAWKLGGTLVPLNFQAGKRAIAANLTHAEVCGVVLSQGMGQVAEELSRSGIPAAMTALEGPPPAFSVRSVSRSDPETAVLFYTSGTTGTPKAVPVSHTNLIDNVDRSVEHFTDLQEGDIFLNVLPNFHALGFTTSGLLPLLGGFPQVILPNFMPAETTLEAIRTAEVSVVIAVPTMITLLLGAIARGAPAPATLRMLISGGDRFPGRLDDRARKLFGVGVLEGYGLTETSPVVSVNPNYTSKKPGTVGTVLDSYDVEVRDAGGKVVPSGREGTLWVRGPSVFKGYFRDPDQTAERMKDGWFNTGDVVRLDDEGYLSILDRETEIIIVGGFNVYPTEVEAILQEIPEVRESAVVGVPHHVSGEIVKAYVVTNPGAQVQVREILSFCRDRLAHYKVPRLVEFVEELPRSSIGKVLKQELRRR
ncbi:MAG: AMP-binding protein [Thermovirgaceae bacterium]